MKPIVLVLILAALTTASTLAGVGAEKEARQALQARYDQLNRALERKDIKGIEEVFTPDCAFTMENEGRVRTIKTLRFLQLTKASFKVLSTARVKTQIVSLNAAKDGFATTINWTGESTLTPPGKEAHPETRRVSQTIRDTWKKTDRGWQIVQRGIQR